VPRPGRRSRATGTRPRCARCYRRTSPRPAQRTSTSAARLPCAGGIPAGRSACRDQSACVRGGSAKICRILLAEHWKVGQ
jgi:hypothetical protein